MIFWHFDKIDNQSELCWTEPNLKYTLRNCFTMRFQKLRRFLVACTRLYTPLCPMVGWLVRHTLLFFINFIHFIFLTFRECSTLYSIIYTPASTTKWEHTIRWVTSNQTENCFESFFQSSESGLQPTTPKLGAWEMLAVLLLVSEGSQGPLPYFQFGYSEGYYSTCHNISLD